MSNAMRAGLVLLVILVLVILLASLRSCESPTETSQGPIQYDNTHEVTTGTEGIQYDNALPETGGITVW